MKITLADLPPGAAGILEDLDLRADVAARLMELGFMPGATILAVRSAPGGDPRVFRVDGCDIALRCDTARQVWLELPT